MNSSPYGEFNPRTEESRCTWKIVAAKTRAVWRSINARDLDVPWKMAAEDLRFTFVGATPLGDSFVGR